MTTLTEALSSGGKRAKIHDAQMVFKLPKRAKELVNEVALKQGASDGAVLREALAEYFERRGYRA